MSKVMDKLNEFKGVILFVTFIIGSYVGMVIHIQTAVAAETAQIRAQTALIHDDIYLNSRIKYNELEKEIYEGDLEALEEYIGEDEPSSREERKLQYLREEIARLKADTIAAQEIMREKIAHSDEE